MKRRKRVEEIDGKKEEVYGRVKREGKGEGEFEREERAEESREERK